MMQLIWSLNLVFAIVNLACFALTGDWSHAAVGAFGLLVAVLTSEGLD